MQWRNRRLRRAQIGGADLNRVGAERKGRRDSAPVAIPPAATTGKANGVAHLRQERDQTRLRVDIVGQEHAPMPACLAALGNDCVDSALLEPARLGDSCGGRKDQRAGRFDARKQLGGRQAEMKADDRRPRFFNHCA